MPFASHNTDVEKLEKKLYLRSTFQLPIELWNAQKLYGEISIIYFNHCYKFSSNYIETLQYRVGLNILTLFLQWQ